MRFFDNFCNNSVVLGRGGGEKSIFDFRNDFARPFASARISATTFKRRVALIGLEPRIKGIKTERYSQKYDVA